MARSAKPAKGRKKKPVVVEEQRNLLQEGAAGLGSFIARNPVLVGGSTAFLVALSYVSANALWYQPHAHSGALFATRNVQPFPQPALEVAETTIKIERPVETSALEPAVSEAPAQPPVPTGDPTVERVQSVLKDLNFYTGTVDGRNGPATRSAVEAYQKKIGMAATGEIDAALLHQLGAADRTAGIAPRPAPAPAAAPVPAPKAEPAKVSVDHEARLRRIQAGLKAFGNQGIDVDGKMGGRTRSGIREFQALFGLPETGEPDEAVYAKMKEIGLTN